MVFPNSVCAMFSDPIVVRCGLFPEKLLFRETGVEIHFAEIDFELGQ